MLHTTSQQGKEPKRRHKSRRPTLSHTLESHEHTKLETIVCVQRTWCRPVLCLCLLLLSLWVDMAFAQLIEGLVLLLCSILSDLTLFPPPPSQGFLSSEGRDLMESLKSVFSFYNRLWRLDVKPGFGCPLVDSYVSLHFLFRQKRRAGFAGH